MDFKPQIPNNIKIAKSNNNGVDQEFWEKFHVDLEKLATIVEKIEKNPP